MSVLGSLLGRRPSRERPDLAAWISGASPVLVVEAGAPGASGATFPGARVLRHETSGGPGLPFHERDPRRLPAGEGEFRAVVLVDVVDKVLDVGFALDDARRAVARGGFLLLVQTVSPEDFVERALWNAVARMRDARLTWTPSGKQFAALASGLGMDRVREAEWEETADPAATLRPGTARELALLLDAAAAREATTVVRDGKLVLERRAVLLRRS